MLAAVLHGPGPADAFSLEDVPVPGVGIDDVLIKVEACGVSYRDVVERNGTYRRDVSFPLIIGLEISGRIVEVGVSVRDLRPGDHVCSKAFSSCGDCRYCRSGRETTCRRRKPVRGGYAEFVALPQDAVVPVPEIVPFEVSCMLGPGAGVALNAVRNTANVEIGDTVLVTGATGGVGLPAVQIAKRAGGRVFAVTRSEAKSALLRASGADEVIVAGANEDFSAQVRAMTGGEGVSVVIDTIGSAIFDAAFASLAPHGRYAVVGQLNGDEVSINLARIFFKRAQLLGVGSVSRAQLADVVQLTADGTLRPVVGSTMRLRDVAEAHRLVEQAAVNGRIVIKP